MQLRRGMTVYLAPPMQGVPAIGRPPSAVVLNCPSPLLLLARSPALPLYFFPPLACTFAQVSLRVTVRLKTGLPGSLSVSQQK